MNKISDIIAIAGCDRPSQDDGWFSFVELYAEAKKGGISPECFRRRLNEKVDAGELEKTNWGKNTYFRIRP